MTRLHPPLFLFLFFFSVTCAKTFHDDSLAVAEILALNGLDSVPVSSVISTVTYSEGSRISSLYLDRMGLHLLPESVGNLDSLETLTISGNNLTELPQAIGKLSRLRHLSCYENRIFELPPTFANLQKLETAYFIRNNFTSFPQVVYGMPNLKLLDLGGNHLTELPEFIGECITLEKLYINDNYIRQLPEHITNIPLEVVHVAGNALCNPSEPIVSWLNLHDYHKENAKWQTYQACSYYDYDLRYVNDFLIANGWNSVSAESVITVENGEITGIDISAQKLNGFRSSSEKASDSGHTLVIPYDFVYMKHLRSLNLSGIKLETLPTSIDTLCHLEELDLSNNRLVTLPDVMASFRRLTSLNVSGNQIATVSSKVEQWADIYSPGWRNQQVGTATVVKPGQTKARPFVSIAAIAGQSSFQVQFTSPVIAEIAVFSLSGRLIESYGKTHFKAGEHRIPMNRKQMPDGAFLIAVKSGNQIVASSKIVR